MTIDTTRGRRLRGSGASPPLPRCDRCGEKMMADHPGNLCWSCAFDELPDGTLPPYMGTITVTGRERLRVEKV